MNHLIINDEAFYRGPDPKQHVINTPDDRTGNDTTSTGKGRKNTLRLHKDRL